MICIISCLVIACKIIFLLLFVLDNCFLYKVEFFDFRVTIQRVTIKSAGEVQQVKQGYSRQESSSSVTTTTTTAQTQERQRSRETSSAFQRLSTGEQLSKSASSSAVTVSVVREQECESDRTNLERPVTPSISSIGGAVLRSKTADIERMLKIQTTTKQTKKTTSVTVSSEEDKKMKRKYTDSRHLTRTLPQTSETAVETDNSRTEQRKAGVVYKRRELISSEPKERRGFFN